MRLSVLIPTYRRPESLLRCLDALESQERRPDEVVCVVRDTDDESYFALKPRSGGALPIKIATIDIGGQVCALNAGLKAITGDVVAITDDDTMPHKCWLALIERHFAADDKLGALGGRDWVYHGDVLDDGAATTVGRIYWYGQVRGNHHIGVGEAREADILKGANMIYRTEAVKGLQFDLNLRGTGAQVHNDLDFSLAVRRRGWRIVYDPKVAVDHFPAQRFDENQRDAFNVAAYKNSVHNETYVVLKHLGPAGKIVFPIWAVLMGTKNCPGLLQTLRLSFKGVSHSRSRFFAVLSGRMLGYKTYWTYGASGNVATATEKRLQTSTAET